MHASASEKESADSKAANNKGSRKVSKVSRFRDLSSVINYVGRRRLKREASFGKEFRVKLHRFMNGGGESKSFF